MPEGRKPRALLVSLAFIVVVLAGLAVTGVVRFGGERDGEEEHGGEESLLAFAREHSSMSHKIPLAVLKEKLGHGGEASREALDGPAQQQVDQRAWPRTYVETKRAQAARAAYQRAPATLPGSAFRSRADRTAEESSALAAPWKELGPITPFVDRRVTYTGAPTTNSGRVTAMAVDPNCGTPGKHCRMWVAAAGGGIFRTLDALAAQPKWGPVDNGLTTNAFGSLVIDPNDATGNTLYAGSGEPNGSSDSEAGLGLFRSTDGGDHWSLVPGSAAVAKDRSIGSIAIEPGNAGHIYIGTDLARHGSSASNGGRRTPPGAPALGLYESTDHGVTFDNTQLPTAADGIDAATGNDYFTGGVNKVELDPIDAGTVYAAVFGYGIWRRPTPSSNWEQVFATAHPADSIDPDNNADPFGDRTEFDLADLGGGKVRMYVGDSSDAWGDSMFWRTDDVGQDASALVTPKEDGVSEASNIESPTAWQKLSSENMGDPGFGSYGFCQGQCGYDIFVAADPSHPDTVFLGGSMNYDEIFGSTDGEIEPGRTNGRAVIRSTDAGESFTDMTNDMGQPRPNGMHPDQHAIAFNPHDSEWFFVGSDGGVIRSEGQYDDQSGECISRGLQPDAKAFCEQMLQAVPRKLTAINDGLATLQFQSLSPNPAAPLTDVIGGTQDNGTWAFTGSPAWTEVIGGDGGQSTIDPASGIRVHSYFGPTMDVNHQGNNPDTWLYMSQPMDDAQAAYNAWLDGDQPADAENFSFYVPLARDPRHAGTLFTGGEYVWRTQDGGGDAGDLNAHCRETAFSVGDGSIQCGDWERLGGADGHIADDANYIVATERAPSDDGTLWVGRRRGGLFVSHNANAPADQVTFTRVDSDQQPGRFISGIHVDPRDPNHAWVSYSGYNAYTPDQPGHVFDVRLPATGEPVWTDISDGIGDQPVTDVAGDDATGDLYASTDFGVLRRPAGATTWEKAADGLPMVAVYSLAVESGARVLYAATHGRGAWRVDLPSVQAPGPDTPGEPPPNGGPGTNPPPSKRPVRIRRLKVHRKGRTVTVTMRTSGARKVQVTVLDQKRKRIGRKTVGVKRAGALTVRLKVTPRRTTSLRRGRWTVSVVGTGAGGRTTTVRKQIKV